MPCTKPICEQVLEHAHAEEVPVMAEPPRAEKPEDLMRSHLRWSRRRCHTLVGCSKGTLIDLVKRQHVDLVRLKEKLGNNIFKAQALRKQQFQARAKTRRVNLKTSFVKTRRQVKLQQQRTRLTWLGGVIVSLMEIALHVKQPVP